MARVCRTAITNVATRILFRLGERSACPGPSSSSPALKGQGLRAWSRKPTPVDHILLSPCQFCEPIASIKHRLKQGIVVKHEYRTRSFLQRPLQIGNHGFQHCLRKWMEQVKDRGLRRKEKLYGIPTSCLQREALLRIAFELTNIFLRNLV